jgi:AAA ATPase domain
LRPSSVESRFDALHADALTELVGREEELDLLLRRWSKAKTKTDEGQVVLLSGEPGIGKSRLTAALLERIAAEPYTRLHYFCSPQHTDSALYPIISQMERAAGFAHDDSAQAKLDKLDVVLAQASTSIENNSRQRCLAVTLFSPAMAYATVGRSLSSAANFNIAEWRHSSRAASVNAASLTSASTGLCEFRSTSAILPARGPAAKRAWRSQHSSFQRRSKPAAAAHARPAQAHPRRRERQARSMTDEEHHCRAARHRWQVSNRQAQLQQWRPFPRARECPPGPGLIGAVDAV